MSSVPTPLGNVASMHAAPPLGPDDLARKRAEKSELEDLAEDLSKLREKLETALDTAKSGYVSLRARALAAATAKTLTGAELQKITGFLVESQARLEKLEKYMKRWTYADLAIESLAGKTERDRQEARAKLGYTIFKDTSSELMKLAREVGLLSEKFTAKEFLIKVLGKGAVLVLEGVELPLTVFIEVMSPTEMGDGTLYGPGGSYTKQKQAECKKLLDDHAPSSQVNKCMAEALSLQRGEMPQHHTRKHPSHGHKKHRPLHLDIHPQHNIPLT